MDGFDQGERRGLGVHAAPPGPAPELLALGARTSSLFDNFFASAQGPSFPNHLYSIAATSGGAHDNPRQDTGLLRLEHVRVRRAAISSSSRSSTARAKIKRVPPCFDFLTEGDLLTGAGIPWAYYAATRGPEGLHLVGVRARSTATAWTRDRWQRHMFPVDDVVERHPSGAAAAGHVDHPALRALRAPRVQLLPRRELDDEGDRRDHALAHVEGHGDLPHVGRLRRVLRSRAAAAGRRLRVRHPGPDAGDQPVRAARAWSAASSASSRASSGSSRTTGGSTSSRTATGTRRRCSRPSTSTRSRGEPDPLELRDDCEGPIWAPAR